MLKQVSIRDFVLIRELDITVQAGFTAVTGETGAGKSIILDAIGLCLGAPADKRYVRKGMSQAVIAIELAPAKTHIIWSRLHEAGIQADPGDALILKRIIKMAGPSRALVNDQPVSAGLLADLARDLIELHGQHAASALMRPASHQALLDTYGGHTAALAACDAAWHAYMAVRAKRETVAADTADLAAQRAELQDALATLSALAPESGEAAILAGLRLQLMQAERMAGHLTEAETALNEPDLSGQLALAARALERICRLPGFEPGSGPAADAAFAAHEAFERALIEIEEGVSHLGDLTGQADPDASRLEQTEARLFALRAAARAHGCTPDDLPDKQAELASALEAFETEAADLAALEARERDAFNTWQATAQTLSAARLKASTRLEKAAHKELAPLKLGQVKLKVEHVPIEAGASGAQGQERVIFLVETNPGAGFGPLHKIASGGELARMALALKCALAEQAGAATLIFDEADQGVGGAVAAAIGERLARLAKARQVLAVTHSPQVAAAATHQWRVRKDASGVGEWSLTGLDEKARREEIARMLSGSRVTREARAAARRLMEDA